MMTLIMFLSITERVYLALEPIENRLLFYLQYMTEVYSVKFFEGIETYVLELL